MSKVICDICGTAYPESSENCPVCGCSRDFGLDSYEEELMMDTSDFYRSTKKKSREIFDFDEVNQEDDSAEEEESYDEDEGYAEEEPRSNTALVVILLILIVLLLVTAGFFFIRYMLPNMVKETVITEPTAVTAATEQVETLPEETTEPTIPCTDIVIPGGKIELGKDGKWLMNVQVYPENTTDVLRYASHDEAVVTVDEGGTVTAVGEGETVIEVTCGIRQIKCNVIVDYALNAAAEATGAVPALQVEQTDATAESETGTDATQETGNTEVTKSTEATESMEATEAPEETTGSMELKLKKTDITMFARYSSVILELDCDIPAKDIKWFTMDSTVAIVQEGKVTATGSGMTRIYAEYNGQQVQCIVRCTF